MSSYVTMSVTRPRRVSPMHHHAVVTLTFAEVGTCMDRSASVGMTSVHSWRARPSDDIFYVRYSRSTPETYIHTLHRDTCSSTKLYAGAHDALRT